MQVFGTKFSDGGKMAISERLLTVSEAAERTGYKPATVRAKILKREWPYCKVGRSVRLKESFLTRLIEDSEVPARAS
jgi:excisionase family DNA binding protein